LLVGVVAPPSIRGWEDGTFLPQPSVEADVRGFGGVMSEVVVQISAEEGRDSSRLTNALDAFAKWAVETGLSTDTGDAPDIMMMTEFDGGEMRRKLVFQDREHAARFLVFWRVERQRSRGFDAVAVGA